MIRTTLRRFFPALAQLNIPNAMTSVALVLDVFIVALLGAGQLKLAAMLFVGVLSLDHADGIVARRLGQTSELGEQLDSLADAVSFCVLPAALGWMLGLRSPLGLVLLASYLLAGVWRLAWFNTEGMHNASTGAPSFRGLPTTYAACGVVVLVCVTRTLGLPTLAPLAVLFPLLAALMVSDLRIRKRGPLLPLTIVSTLSGVLLFVLFG